MNLTTHLHLVLKLSMRAAIPPLTFMPSCSAQGQLYLYLALLYFYFYDQTQKEVTFLGSELG